MLLRIMSWNVLHGAHREGRWPRLAEIIRANEPSIVLLQECRGWLERDMSQVIAAENDLGMRVWVGFSASGGHTVLAHRRDLPVMAFESNPYTLLHGYGAGRFAIPGLPVPLVVISAHLTPYSVDAAAAEVRTLVARAYRYDGLGVIGGDLNSCPVGDPEPPWAEVQPYNRMIRCLPRETPDEPWRANTIVGRTLTDGQMIDVAAHLADLRGDVSLRAATGRGRVRVDRFHVTAALRDAVVDYWRVDPDGASDHWGIVTVLDTDRVDLSQVRAYT
ncbi:endonuclease/exonuclease/phosphatase family protein [Sphaerisporangium sp. NPDC049002]|uniref:endonuclease/exonuclease/phosphatase family protein n=1 Tax=Sphaerisporangium sp. NPDC049002 TaxID=3155392 RepID=UPI0033D1B866